ncbi:hypothetical protein Aph02nite_22900 [Actinoplanes philippinensis]|uniref:Peptidase inhibitor family I36 n=1 Tax=Actinoplanes philippinensis TaxID=35752 RepID=A0A1I2MCV1_9ACTN|nr:hypothetical protein [Actinoplanes philippinensis]GIE76340.1 hypothetical protein Aph02nite_22900 [Actinoplanes philippinensis]SFF89314.1 hypothetical protein SAMN05421541_12850 [Actinoplanes philippinensis]
MKNVKRGLAWATAVVASLAVTLGPMAAPAQAARTCTGQTDSNLCLWIDLQSNGVYRIHVGIDVRYLSLADAQEYIDDPGDPFRAYIIGRNGSARFIVPVVGLGASAESGLSGDFETYVSASALNENPNGQDELRAQVLLIDTDTNTVTKTFTSGKLFGNWS